MFPACSKVILQNVVGRRAVSSTEIYKHRYLRHPSGKFKYQNIAPFIGLLPILDLRDAPLFNLHRSRIPTALFKNIVKDMDFLLIQYGSLGNHDTKEARSRLFAPVSIPIVSAQMMDFLKIYVRSSTI